MKLIVNRYLTILSLCLFPFLTRGQVSEVLINQNAKEVDISESYDILKDSSYMPDDILNLFHNDTSERVSLLNPKETYWLYIPIIYNGSDKKEVVVSLGTADRATLYQRRKGEHEWLELKTGWLVPQSDKHPTKGEITQIQFLVELIPSSSYDILIKFDNPTQGKFKIEPVIQSADTWEISYLKEHSVKNLIFGVILGFLGIMFCYNFLVFVFSSAKIYLYYSIYILMGAIYTINFSGFLLENVFMEYPKSYAFFRTIPPCIGFISYAFFAQSFLETEKWLPKWHKVFNFFKFWMLCSLLIAICALPFTESELFSRKLPALGHLGSQVFLLIFIIKLFTTKNKLAHYFAVGAMSFSLTALFLGYVVISDVFPLIVGLGVAYLGLAGELITFSLGLGYRIKLAEVEKIEAQKETAKILETQNETLEKRVIERTYEVEKKNEEILTQNEELHQQQEEIISQRDYIEAKNKDLVYKNQQITDSIRYAKTIQEAILPFKERISAAFESHFILYKPKDIVSGDFYWQETVGNTQFIAVLDCTGHGVPGGFMSMIGFSILNDIAMKLKAQSPAEMLEKLNENLIRVLQQEDDQALNRDGMDVALCAIEDIGNNKLKVLFCGAKRPLYYITPSGKELLEVKGDRKSIGGYQPKDKPFTDTELVVEKGTTLYLTTDGFADQNNDNGKKFGSPALRQLLEELWQYPLEKQHESLEKIFKMHCGAQPQRDDVAIIGIKV